MSKAEYLQRVSRLAHWRFTKEEADEIVADYQQLLDQRQGSDAELIGELGSPAHAVGYLVPSGEYLRWLAAFGTMVLCLGLMVALLFFRQSHPRVAVTIFALGLGLSLVWFGRGARTGRRLPKGQVLLLLLPALCAGAAGLAIAYLALGPALDIPAAWYGGALRWVLRLAGGVTGLLGLLGLVRARLEDRRWRALYALCLTVAVLCVITLSLFQRMDDIIPWTAYLWSGVGAAAVGLTVTGLSLC